MKRLFVMLILRSMNITNGKIRFPSLDGLRVGNNVVKFQLSKFIAMLFIFIALLLNSVSAQTITAKQILEKIDKNFESETQISTSTMTIQGRRGSRTIKAKSYARGGNDAFTEYLYPVREKGTKMLKLDNQLWIYTPMADRIIKISGHMLRQSVMGSDLSYEDFMSSDRLEDDYEAAIIGQDTVKGRPCWILKLKAISDDAAYFSQQIKVDQTRFIVLEANRFARSGKLLKTTKIEEVFKVNGRWYPQKIVFKDELKDGKGTEFYIESIEFNKKIPAYLFTKAALKR